MEQTVADYLADKVIADIRAGHQLPSELQEALTSYPVIDRLRARVRPDDFESLRALCDSPDPASQNFGLALLRNIEREEGVRRYLEEMWERPDLPFRTRIGLQFQLSNYDDLTAARKEEFLNFIREHWGQFVENQKDWCGGAGRVIDFCRQRLEATQFPAGKKWLYLCAAAAAEDAAEARALVEPYTKDPDSFLRRVAEEVIGHLGVRS